MIESAQKRAVIITGPDFQDEEFVYPYYRLLEEGFHVDVATKDKAVFHGKYGIPAKPTIDVKDLKESNYDAVVVPGGTEAPDRVRQIKEVLSFIQAMHHKGKTVAAICHGPWVLISAGVVKGKRATCYVGMKDDLINAGADYADLPVVVDGNLITAPHYRNNGDFMRAVIDNVKTGGRIDFKNYIVQKPWGYEYLMYQNENVAMWYLHIKHGEKTSLHSHAKKKTSLILLSGEAEVSFLNDTHRIKPLSKTMIRQGLFHSTTALSPEGVHIIETESPNDKTDLIRLVDRYGREGKPYEGLEHMRPIDHNCLQFMDGQEFQVKTFHGCKLSIEKFQDNSGFKQRLPGEILTVLDGGLVSRVGIPVLGPGDVTVSENLDRLNEMCVSPGGAKLFVVRKAS